MFSPEGYDALTRSAGVVARGDRGVLVVTGEDRLTWLQGLVTNDVAGLAPGDICEAAYLTPQGRMITDLRIAQRADRTWLDVPASLAEALHQRLDGLLFSEDAQIADVSDRIRLVEVHGPDAPRVVEGEPVVRDDTYEMPGFSAFLPAADVPDFLARVRARGAEEITLETLDVVRVEAGRPAFLIDMDEHTIPLEAGLERRAISFNKGCYVGQEVIIRVTHRGGGRVAKRLVGLRFENNELPHAQDRVVVEGRDVGRITSAVRSPALGVAIALGYLQRDYTDLGTTVQVAGQNTVLAAEVAALPFLPLALRLQKAGV